MPAVRTREWLPPTRSTRQDLIAVAIPVLVGAVLCAIELNTRSFWLDEGSTFAITSQHGAALWRGIKGDGGNMLLYYLLIHEVVVLFGSDAWVLRLPSLLAEAVTGGLVTVLGLRLFRDRRQAVAGGLLTVVSLPLVFWGQDARGYALMVMFATASMLAFLMILEGESRRGAPVAYVLTTLAALYVGYDAGLLILAQLALLPLVRDRAKVVIGCLAVVAVLSVPLAVLAVERGSGQLFWVGPLNAPELGQTALTLLSAGMPPNFHHTITTMLAAVLTAALLIAAVRLASRDGWRLRLLVSWLLVPAVVGIAVAAAGEPVELARCAILLMPALSLLIVWLLSRPQMRKRAALAVFAALLLLRLLQIIPAYGSSPENWKAATAYVLATANDPAVGAGHGACIAFYPQDGRESFDYYARSAAPAVTQALTPVLPTLAWGKVEPYVEKYATLTGGQLAAVTSRCPEFFLVAGHQGQTTGPEQYRANFARFQALQDALASRYQNSSMIGFGWAARITVVEYWN